MFKIIEGDFKNNKYSDEEYLDNWPMLYICVFRLNGTASPR